MPITAAWCGIILRCQISVRPTCDSTLATQHRITGLVLRGWLQARLLLCISQTPCRSVCEWVCMCSDEGIHFVQWVFKELSTETGFPQTTITSTPGTPNFLSWYFFFSFCFHLCFSLLQLPRGRSPPPHPAYKNWDYFLFPIHVASLSRLELKLCGASTFSRTR